MSEKEETKTSGNSHLNFIQMKEKIRKEMKGLFKIAENAFAEMDFNGHGFIEEEDFFHTLLNYKLPYSKDEVIQLFKHERWFIRAPKGRLNFEIFKKTFFPQNKMGEENEDHEDVNYEKLEDDKTKADFVISEMKKIEELLRQKFSNNWVSIRKAFLDIDMDYDGFITAEDIARQFGKDNQKLDFRILRTLIRNRDSRRKGKIDFKDFCRWMGGAIEPSETFYFRHDSLVNPQYEENKAKQDKNNGEFK